MPITYTGSEDIKITLGKMEQAIRPDIKKMGDIGRVLMGAVDKNFMTSGHGTWKSKSPNSRPGSGILQLTGKLRASMTPRIGTNYAEVKPSNAVYKYGSVNNWGSKSGRIPARAFMQLWPDDVQAAMDTYIKPIDEAMK